MESHLARRTLTIPWGSAIVLSALAFFDSIFNYLWTGNGIHGTEGALLVIVSTLLMTAAAVLVGLHFIRGGLRAVFVALLVLDFVGTGAAAYLLEAWIVLGLDVLAAIAWLATIASSRNLSTAS